MADGIEFLIRLRALKDPIKVLGERPVPIRLRWLLKTALRSYGFRCESVAEVPVQVATAERVQ